VADGAVEVGLELEALLREPAVGPEDRHDVGGVPDEGGEPRLESALQPAFHRLGLRPRQPR
jgi:hypothetical protein